MLLEQTEEGRGQLLMEVEQLDVMSGRSLLLSHGHLDCQCLQTPLRLGLFIPLQ